MVQTLNQAVQKHGLPAYIRVDNGPEFISKDLDLWAYANREHRRLNMSRLELG